MLSKRELSSKMGVCQGTYLFPVKLDISVNDETSSFIDRRSKAAPEDEDVYPSFDFREHQTSNWR